MYTEKQLESFSKVPGVRQKDKAIRTHEAVREAIRNYYNKDVIKQTYGFTPNFDIFLQGSYKNDTDVQKTSDVDLVVCLENAFKTSNTLIQEQNFGYIFSQFNADIKKALEQHFTYIEVENANKCLKITEHKAGETSYGNADIIPAFSYRNIINKSIVQNSSSIHYDYYKGITFLTNGNRWVVNYPKFHYGNLAGKSKRTSGRFKETVRMFKNIKDDLLEKGIITDAVVKSYFIENMLYNVDDNLFSGNYQNRFTNIVNFIVGKYNDKQNPMLEWKNANGFDYLVKPNNTGNTPTIERGIWAIDNVYKFLKALWDIRYGN